MLATCHYHNYFGRKSASCTHVSAMLHALVAMSPIHFVASSDMAFLEGDDEAIPVTSLPCRWKVPKARKESNLKISDANFKKHAYGKTSSAKYTRQEDFDPRPTRFRNNAQGLLKEFLGKVRGKGLGVSMLFDESTRYWSDASGIENISGPNIPPKNELEKTIEEFKNSLSVSEQRAREIERSTINQRCSSLWFEARRYRLTASIFGEIHSRKHETTPDAFVRRILEQPQFTSPATRWGQDHEKIAIEAYQGYQHSNGHAGLTVCPVGFYISSTHPFLGASPDGGIYDPTDPMNPYGYLEIKCPYVHRDKTPLQACSDKKFCCTEVNGVVTLRRSHHYYCQVQGQMAVGDRSWCDFVIYTCKGLSVERIPFDNEFWNNELLPKLVEFYDKCLAPEIVSPVRVLGLKVRDLRRDNTSQS